VRGELGLSEHLVRTAYNGIDVEELERSRAEPFRPDTGEFDNYLVNVAAFEPSKGQDVLLQAFTRLVRDGLRSALVLVGRSTPYLATLRGMVRQLGLQQHVSILPDLDHLRTLAVIRQARLLVQPSREEPFGITLLEAGYLGTPIVATRTGGIPEVLGGYYPYLAAPDDPDALAAAIDEALFNPTDTERQVGLIRRRVSTQFTWGTAYRTYEALWLGTGQPPGRTGE
jgi:glycosyltransferase involved in cell wall biosynthesis